MKKKVPRRRIDVNIEELDRIIDGAKTAPLSESDSEKLKTALHALGRAAPATVKNGKDQFCIRRFEQRSAARPAEW